MDTEDMIYLHGGGEKGMRVVRSDGDEEDSRSYRKYSKSLNSSFDEDYGESHRRREDGRREKKTEIMYIRSPPEPVKDEDEDDNFRSISEADALQMMHESGDYDPTERRRSSTKQVSFQMQPIFPGEQSVDSYSVSQKEDERSEKLRRSPSNHTVYSNDRVFICEDADSHALPVETSLVNGQRPASRGSGSGGSGKYITKVTLPGTVEYHGRDEEVIVHSSPSRVIDAERVSASDSDSGIGTRFQKTELNLKNKNLMEKKSIFTLAYDGVKTDRIQTGGSGRDSF